MPATPPQTFDPMPEEEKAYITKRETRKLLSDKLGPDEVKALMKVLSPYFCQSVSRIQLIDDDDDDKPLVETSVELNGPVDNTTDELISTVHTSCFELMEKRDDTFDKENYLQKRSTAMKDLARAFGGATSSEDVKGLKITITIKFKKWTLIITIG